MGSKEVFGLRKDGHSGEALEMARAEYPQNKSDIWFLRAYAWPLYDRAKALVDRYEAKQLPGPALSGEFRSCMREFARMAKPLRGDLAFSHMLRLAYKVSKDWDEFLPFARWAGVDAFSEEDNKPFVTDDGKTIDSLKVRFIRSVCREAAVRANDDQADAELIQWGQALLDQTLAANPDDQWLNYYRSRLHLVGGEIDQAIEHLMPVLQRQSCAAWPWALLAEIIEPTRPGDSLTCLIHAARLGRKEQEVAKIRIRLANRLAEANRFDEAAMQVELTAQWRKQNSYRVPPALQQMLASDWFKLAQSNDRFKKLPNVSAPTRELLQELDPTPLTYTLGVIENINTKKSLSYAATGAEAGFVLTYKAFPEIAKLAIGTIIEIGHTKGDHHARDWKSAAIKCIPSLYETVSGTLNRANDQPFAFIRTAQRDIYVPPALAQRFTPCEPYEVTCNVLWRTNSAGKTGWRAIQVTENKEATQS